MPKHTIYHQSFVEFVPGFVEVEILPIFCVFGAFLLHESLRTVQDGFRLKIRPVRELLVQRCQTSKEITGLIVHFLGPIRPKASKDANLGADGEMLVERAVPLGVR